MPPDIINEETSADVSAHELDNVTLICRASGHPPPKITWRREDHEPMLLKKVGSRDFYKGMFYLAYPTKDFCKRQQIFIFSCPQSKKS